MRRRERGAVLVETAFMISTALTLMLFTVDVGIIGFVQTSADAASFFDAHQNVIGMQPGYNGTPEQFTSGLFPIIKPGDMTTTVVPAPTPSVEVQYGYNPPGGPAQVPANPQRYGGASMMEPVQLEVNVSPSPFLNIAGTQVDAAAQFIEPKWTECGPHYNVSNEDVACGSANAPAYATASYDDAENTPPYYVGYNVMNHCSAPQPWGDTYNNYAACPSANMNFLALGVSSYLDTDNWKPTPFASPGASGPAESSTFQAAAFHQRVYANIAAFLAEYPDQYTLMNDYSGAIYKQLGITKFGDKPTAGFADNRGWVGFAVSNDLSPAKLDPNGIDEAIQCVYNWDEVIAGGFPPGTYTEPGQIPLYPEKQCAANVTE